MQRSANLVPCSPRAHVTALAYTPHLDALAAQEHPEGGWGYVPGQAAHLEPTCLGLLALSLEAARFEKPIARGLDILKRAALPDGTYRLERGRAEALWPTALALFARAALGASIAELKPTAARLLAVQGRLPDNQAADLHDINIKLVG